MGLFDSFFYGTRLYYFIHSRKLLFQLEEKKEKYEIEIEKLQHEIEEFRRREDDYKHSISELNDKIAYQESVLKSLRPMYDFEKSKIHNKFEHYQEMWMTWGIELHNYPYQIKRQERATDSIYTPLSLDGDTGKAYFRGKERDYFTTLLSCECPDFQRRNMPCKHMYRLAYELDVYMLDDVEVNPNINNLLRISDVTPIVNKLSTARKDLFSDILEYPMHSKKTEIKNLLDLELVQICSDKKILLDHYTKDELFSLLPDELDIKIPKSIKKGDLVNLINDSIPSVVTNLEKLYVVVEPHDNIKHLVPMIRNLL